MTPRELARIFEGKKRAADSLHDLVMQAAWTISTLRRSKKIPPLQKFMLTPAAKPKRSSWQQMYAVAQSWAAQSGEIRTEKGTS